MCLKAPAGRYELEWRQLDEAGYQPTVVDEGSTSGIVVWKVAFPDKQGEATYPITIYFPHNYPFGIPDLKADRTFPVGRHIESRPDSYLLCTLADPGNSWDGEGETVRDLLERQVQRALDIHLGRIPPESAEALEPDRPVFHVEHQPHTRLLVQETNLPVEQRYGAIEIGLTSAQDVANPPIRLICGVLRTIKASNGEPIARFHAPSDRWKPFYVGDKNRIRGRWVRLQELPSDYSAVGLLRAAEAVWPAVRTPHYRDRDLDVLGLLLPEEVQYQGETMESWVFVVRHRRDRKKKQGGPGFSMYTMRGDRLTREEAQARTPRLTPLQNKRVVVVGLGALGAPLVWQLARSGIGELRLVDNDLVEIGNIPRWLTGVAAVGNPKTHWLVDYVLENFPFTHATPYHCKVGGSQPGAAAQLEEAFEGADLIIDCAANRAVSQYLAEEAQARAVPYLWAYATPGAWGGNVGRVVPDVTEGCWYCAEWAKALAAGELAETAQGYKISRPPSEPDSNVQSKGCFHPTFSGSGVDLDSVSNLATRLAIATLCRGEPGGYPDFDWNVAVLSQWDKEKGIPTVPQWTTSPLARHPECPNHAS
ncbi:MAG: hypothetical protein CMK32_02025 [Porticoccaceae bacterium]|nr:hypothetical protein [Porticoccaceae bacterium]